MQQVYSNVTKVMVDSRQGSNLLYLPLDKLIQSTTPGAAPIGSAAPAAAASQPTDVPAPLASGNASPDPRSRDGGRSRDRDGR
jgi:membrane protease subunit HflK